MKIIFSRKGFDSSAGGCASPIIDNRPISLPIPTRMPSPTRFCDVAGNIASLANDLSNGKVRPESRCHLDPDLDHSALRRLPGWRGSLGQVSAAQSHLGNQDVGPGDIFLFWGLYRPVEFTHRWRYNGEREHRIFGWLQIDCVLPVGSDPEPVLLDYPWLAEHPHLQPGWSDSNTVYVATDNLRIGRQTLKLPGWGQFPTGHRLTEQGSKKPSTWIVPDWMNPKRGGVGMTYHPEQRWHDHGRLTAAARGQEFVTDIGDRADAYEWVFDLFKGVL